MVKAWIIKAGMALLLLALLGGGLAAMLWYNRMHRFDDLIQIVAMDAGLDARLVQAVVWRESRFRPEATGKVGELGLMQVTPLVGQEWAKASGRADFDDALLKDPEINLRAGTWYLARALKQWEARRDPVPYALAQYNAGRSNALRWAEQDGNHPETFIENITYPTTRHYVRSILKRYRG